MSLAEKNKKRVQVLQFFNTNEIDYWITFYYSQYEYSLDGTKLQNSHIYIFTCMCSFNYVSGISGYFNNIKSLVEGIIGAGM